MPRIELLNTGRPKNKPWLKKLNGEWIQAQQIGENRTSKERADGPAKKEKDKTSHTEERKEPLHEKKQSY